MGYYGFTTPAMVSVSGGWTDPVKERPIFERHALLHPMLPLVDDAHNNLITIQVKSSSVAETIRALTDEALNIDKRHDRLFRGAYTMLTAMADITEDEALRARLLSLRNRLFPNGLSGIQAAYIDEAGEVALAQGRLTEDDHAFLSTLPVLGGTMADVINDWIAAGLALGDVERRRAQLAMDKDKESISLSDVTKARSAWAHVAVTVEELVSLCPTMSEEDRNRILQPLHTVEQRMEEKAVRDARKANAETSPETAVVDAAMEEDAEGETDSEIDDTPDTGNDAAGS